MHALDQQTLIFTCLAPVRRLLRPIWLGSVPPTETLRAKRLRPRVPSQRSSTRSSRETLLGARHLGVRFVCWRKKLAPAQTTKHGRRRVKGQASGVRCSSPVQLDGTYALKHDFDAFKRLLTTLWILATATATLAHRKRQPPAPSRSSSDS